jgi:hypothetical protein
MEYGSIVLIEPITGIERQEFDLGSFRQIGRLVDDKSPGFHTRLQRHAITVALRRPLDKAGSTKAGPTKAGRPLPFSLLSLRMVPRSLAVA